MAVTPGRLGGDVYEAGHRALGECNFGKSFGFVAHAMGLIGHEAPRLRHNAEIGYEGTHANRPLEPGMVLSIETGIKHQEAGFIKIEDTLAVTENGVGGLRRLGRDWNQVYKSEKNAFAVHLASS